MVEPKVISDPEIMGGTPVFAGLVCRFGFSSSISRLGIPLTCFSRTSRLSAVSWP